MSVEIISNNSVNSGKKIEEQNIAPTNVQINLDQAIKKIIEREGFVKYKINKNQIVTNGGNYLGDLFEYDIKGETKEGNKELNLFVKNIEENQISVINTKEVYKTEMFMYKEILKVFNKLQEESEIPLHERFRMVKSYDETNNEVIIMENMARKGFRTGNRMDVINIEYAELAIKALAKFHGLSYVLKVKRPEYFEKTIKNLKSPFQNAEELRSFMANMLNITIDHVDEDTRKRIEKSSVGMADRYKAYYDEVPVNGCLCHYDYRPNNIMTKVTNGVVTDIIPVDYQLASYGCPVIDFFYFIFSCTDQQFRRKHLSYLKDLYHESLTKFLDYFDVDVNMVYSREEFENDYKDKLEYGLISTILFLPFILASEDDIPDVTKDELATISVKVDERFDDRLKGIIEDYIQWGLL